MHQAKKSGKFQVWFFYLIYLNYEDKLIINSEINVDISDSLSEIHTMPQSESQRGPNTNSGIYNTALRNQPARYEMDVNAKCIRTEVSCLNVQVDTKSR
jgi:hypothetical protein